MLGNQMATTKKPRRRSLTNSDPGKILDLVMDLTDENCSSMQVKINEYLEDACEAELVFHLVIQGEKTEAYIEAVGSNLLNKKMKMQVTQKLAEINKSSSEHVELLSNLPADMLNILSHHLKDTTKKRVVLYPIADKPFSVIIGVVAPTVTEDAVALLTYECFLFCWPTLKKTISLEYERSLKQKCQQLLKMARRLFTQVASLETLLQIAMDQAKQLTKAEFSSVMLIDVETMQLVETKYFGEGNKESSVRRFPINQGIAGRVLQTGFLVNAKNAKEYTAFDPAIDSPPGVDCKNILCFPIREQSGIIGVGQLINKIGDPYFDAMDEEMALAFSVYCGICIVHSVVYQKIQEAHIRNALANELVMYYMKVSEAEVSRLLGCQGSHSHAHLSSLHFNPRALPLRELPCYAFKMFQDLGFDRLFNIKKKKLACFILYVKKGYRDVPYHSWLHAFNTGQWAYAAISTFKLVKNGYFSELHALMYLIAGFVHDLDHRGTTNSFQIQGHTTLAALYSSEGSVMERHHLAQAICILNTEGCDILESLSRKDYDRALVMLRDYILATDLANYFKNLNDYKAIAVDYQKGNRTHTVALQSLLMNAADLSDQLKDWANVKKTAAVVLTEFFNQGDEEKNRGDLPPVIMDREKCFIPALEVEFLTAICVPLFEILKKIIPKSATASRIIQNHIERWEAAKSVFAEVPMRAGLSVLLSPELDNLIEISMKEKEREAEEQARAADQN